MTIRADLRAASHQGVRIDHGAIAHPTPRVDIHRRHARDAAADIATVANARSTGNDANPAIGCEALHRKRGLVEPRLPRGIDRHVNYRAHAKAEQNAFFYPGIHAPSRQRGSVWLGRANFPGIERLLEALEELKMIVGVSGGWLVEERLDLNPHARSGQPADPGLPPPFRSWRDLPGWAGITAIARLA